MCYVVAKHADKPGCVAIRMHPGAAVVALKREVKAEMGSEKIQMVTIADRLLMENMLRIALRSRLRLLRLQFDCCNKPRHFPAGFFDTNMKEDGDGY